MAAYRNAYDLVTELMSGLARKNCWTTANIAGIGAWMGCNICCPGLRGLRTGSVMLVVDETGNVK